MVLIGYLPADFEDDEKPKVYPRNRNFFLLRGVNERDWRGSEEPPRAVPGLKFDLKLKDYYIN